MPKSYDGFFKRKDLLIELAVVMVIFVIIGGAVFLYLARDTDTTDEDICHTNQRRIEGAARMFKARTGEWPDEIEQIIDYSPLDKIPICPEGKEYDMVFHNDDLTVDCEIHGYYRDQ